jgi:uncharacterized protein (DUF3084 family)
VELVDDPVYQDYVTPSLGQANLLVNQMQARLEVETQAREAAERRVETERQRAETESQRAETERQRAETERQRAKTEHLARTVAEQRNERYLTLLRQAGIEP